MLKVEFLLVGPGLLTTISLAWSVGGQGVFTCLEITGAYSITVDVIVAFQPAELIEGWSPARIFLKRC